MYDCKGNDRERKDLRTQNLKISGREHIGLHSWAQFIMASKESAGVHNMLLCMA